MEKTTQGQLGQKLSDLLTDKFDPQEVSESLNTILDFCTDPMMHKVDDNYLTLEFISGIDLLRKMIQTIESHQS